jgi:colanic acid/amylovoran biosynthesis glycosyltransferase
MPLERIAYIVNVFPKLSETFIANELVHLRARGMQLRIISLRQPTESIRHSLIENAGLLELTTYDQDRHLEVLREFQPQLLHAHFATEPTAAAWSFARELNIPFTFTAHGYDIHRKAPVDFRQRALAAAKVVTVSQANIEFVQRQFSVPADHLRLIPCGVDTEVFKPSGNTRQAEPIILCVARHVVVKNLTLLLEACAILRDRGFGFRCVMIGDGPCREDLEMLRQKLGLSQVEMIGAANQEVVLEWWQKAVIGVLSSSNEGLPVCLLEAGACGLPVVATAVGGVPELVQPNLTGFCTPPGDAVAFADALAELFSKPELRLRLGRAARQHVEQHFSIQKQISSLLGLWEEILEHHAARH